MFEQTALITWCASGVGGAGARALDLEASTVCVKDDHPGALDDLEGLGCESRDLDFHRP